MSMPRSASAAARIAARRSPASPAITCFSKSAGISPPATTCWVQRPASCETQSQRVVMFVDLPERVGEPRRVEIRRHLDQDRLIEVRRRVDLLFEEPVLHRRERCIAQPGSARRLPAPRARRPAARSSDAGTAASPSRAARPDWRARLPGCSGWSRRRVRRNCRGCRRQAAAARLARSTPAGFPGRDGGRVRLGRVGDVGWAGSACG